MQYQNISLETLERYIYMKKREEVLVVVEALRNADLIKDSEVEKAKECIKQALKKVRNIKFKEKKRKNK